MKTALPQQAGDGLYCKPDGTSIRPRNLRALLTHATVNRVTFLCVTPCGDREANLEVHFDSGYKFLHRFASHKVCLEFAENPRRVWNRRRDLFN